MKFVKFETKTRVLCNGKEITENYIVITEDEEAQPLKRYFRQMTRNNVF